MTVAYGIKTVFYLSTFEKNVILTSKIISEELHIPKEYTAKILQSLTKNGLIKSKKGRNGGFYLGIDPSKIKIINIINDLDQSVNFDKCLLQLSKCSPNNCPLRKCIVDLNNQLDDVIHNYSIKELQSKGWNNF